MNAAEKKVLQSHIDALAAARDWCEDAKSVIEDKFNSHGEKWQEGEAGQEMQGSIDALDDLYNDLDNAADKLDSILNT